MKPIFRRKIHVFLVAVLTALILIPQVYAPLFDSYVSGVSDDIGDTLDAVGEGAGQCFQASFNGTIVAAQLQARKTGAPTGTAKMRIWPGEGTLGSTCVGGDTPLTESNFFDISTLAVTTTIVALLFEGNSRISLTSGRLYVLTLDLLECPNCSGANFVSVRADNTAPTHAGNSLIHTDRQPPEWTAQASQDRYFSVEGLTAAQLPTTIEACGPIDGPGCAAVALMNYFGGGIFGGLMVFFMLMTAVSMPFLYLTRTYDSRGEFKGFAFPTEVLIIFGILIMTGLAIVGVLPVWSPVVVMVVIAWLFSQLVWGEKQRSSF